MKNLKSNFYPLLQRGRERRIMQELSFLGLGVNKMRKKYWGQEFLPKNNKSNHPQKGLPQRSGEVEKFHLDIKWQTLMMLLDIGIQ